MVPDGPSYKRIHRWYVAISSYYPPLIRFSGLHLAPNSLSMSTGSIFAGWMMHRTGKYKTINLICGLFPFVATVLILQMKEDSGPIQSWLSIVRRVGCFPISSAILLLHSPHRFTFDLLTLRSPLGSEMPLFCKPC